MHEMATIRKACPQANCPPLQGSPDELLSREWLLTDGCGGFSSGSVVDCPTRRYHGYLLSSKRPPLERFLLLASTLDEVVLGPTTVSLSTFEFEGVFHPTGFELLSDFQLQTAQPDPWVEFSYRHAMFKARKRITLLSGQNAVVLSYQIETEKNRSCRLQIAPFVAMRDYHGLCHRGEGMPFQTMAHPDGLWVQSNDDKNISLALTAKTGAMSWKPRTDWWNGFRYRVEQERGFGECEDLCIPGQFEIQGRSTLDCTIVAAGFVESYEDAENIVVEAPAQSSKKKATEPRGDGAVAARLIKAADQFVVRRAGHGVGQDQAADPGSTTILAGYPWFGDWGRDSFISLEGLLLISRRFDEARRVLATFASAQKNGLIPNRFDDYGRDCDYNSVDASLWFIHAADAYLRYSKDQEAWDEFLFDACRRVIVAFCEGTDFDIRLDDDGLVCCGNLYTQITWMDAKCDGVVFTPRNGNPVEINALWYHCLHLVANRCQKADAEFAKRCLALIDASKKSFVAKFWNESAGCLFDCVDVEPDPAIRPNQILAVSLANSPLPAEKATLVLEVVTEELLTPMGLRTLAPDHFRYMGRCTGSPFDRDQAYHNGTVWSWLIGPYVEAHLRVRGSNKRTKRFARRLLEPLVDHLDSAGLGSVSEIFDADAPHEPRGCPAQAWGVAELLRAWEMTRTD